MSIHLKKSYKSCELPKELKKRNIRHEYTRHTKAGEWTRGNSSFVYKMNKIHSY